MSETMAHLQYMPGDPRLVDQLVYELKSKGIFDQFRKECIADVDTRPAYQNLRQRVESSVASFLARQTWKPDLNKNQLREKLRKHLLDGNYLEQGVERIVDQVVNPKVASVFIPQVEDLVYNYLGIARKKPTNTETATATSSEKEDLLPTDLEAVSPGSVKSNEEKEDKQSVVEERMEVDEIKEDSVTFVEEVKMDQDTRLSGMSELTINDTEASMDKASIPLPTEEIKLENIPAPENSPPNIKKENIDLEKINLPREPNLSTDIPLPDELPKVEKDNGFIKPTLHSEDDESVSDSDSSLRRNMSPLTPIRDFNTENSCDAQQGFENESDNKNQTPNEPSTFRFTIEGTEEGNIDKKEDQNAPCHFSNQINNTFNTPLYDDSSNSNNLQIDYESDVNSKAAGDIKLPEAENSVDSKKVKKDEKKSIHKSSHRSRDSHRDSSSKDKKDHKSSRDSSRHDKKPKDKDSKSHKDKSETEKKDSKDSKHRSSSHKSSHKDSKHRSSSSSKHSSSKDDKKSSSSSKDKTEKSSRDKDRSSNSRSSSHRSEKDRKSDKSKSKDEKENRDKKKSKKEADDHYSLSGRGSHTRRSTDRDSNDGSSSSKGSQNQVTKASDAKKPSKNSSKAGTSASSTSDSPSDKDHVVTDTQLTKDQLQFKPIVRVNHLDTPSKLPKRLPFVPDVTIKKPRFATNMEEAKQKMKMRKFFEEEQKRMNQEAALLLEFQANVRPSLSQVYSSIPGPELEFACVNTVQHTTQVVVENVSDSIETESKQSKAVAETVLEKEIDANKSFENEVSQDIIAETLIAMHREHNTKKEVSNEDNEMIIVVQEQDNRTVLETLTGVDQDSITENQGDTISVELHVPEEVDTGVDVEENPNIEKGMEMNSPSEIKEKIGADESINFEVSIIGEELSDDEEPVLEIDESGVDNEAYDEAVEQNKAVDQETEVSVKIAEDIDLPKDEIPLEYFAEHEKYKSELENDIFDKFLKSFIQQVSTRVMFLMNCDTYEENLIKEAAKSFGNYEVVTYHKNGHVKVPKSDKKVVKDLNVTREVILPTESYTISSKYNSPMFSPKSECSFELSRDYDAKLEEMVNNTSRKQIMEIILGGAAEESPSEMPQIDYCSESNIDIQQEQSINTKTSEIKKGKEENETKKDFNTESVEKTKEVKPVDAFDANADDFDIEQAISVYTIDKNSCRKERERIDEQKEQKESLKRRMEMESSNNNCPILTPNKMRRASESHQITSTTGEESTPVSQNKTPSRSKYLGKAKWVGLPKPKKPAPSPNSPSSDKSVENYEQLPKNPKQPNGKLKTPRTKVQRYDTSDLYKPKLHYLSRRNNVT